jgi:hypothetical protein
VHVGVLPGWRVPVFGRRWAVVLDDLSGPEQLLVRANPRREWVELGQSGRAAGGRGVGVSPVVLSGPRWWGPCCWAGGG